MSRAFVKESDGDDFVDDAPEIPISPHPNHVTEAGLATLKAELDELTMRHRALNDLDHDMSAKLEIAAIERRQRYLAKRIDSAIVHNPKEADPHHIGFGAHVLVEDEEGVRLEFTIVGEDQADPANHLISWTSPLARNLLNRQPGDEVRWSRPKGDIMLEVLSIRYGKK